ncbi:MAG: hypothetical protein M1814_000729 [Vezdaea aestivalis]|nr:MAG: hypothetical protein M1814_000729 [Vezdaea aestivalis]
MKLIIAVPCTLALVYRSISRNSLTPVGTIVAALTATAHAIHPWSLFFTLLVVFFLGGTAVTKVKHNVKARLTLSASGASGGEGPRTHVQVLANSGVASVLILLHAWQLSQRKKLDAAADQCWGYGSDVLVVGAIANYAAVAADTFSSELGILSKSSPRLITSPTLRKVPAGTNGGVTAFGLLAGLGGAAMIAVTTVAIAPFCSGGHSVSWTLQQRAHLALAITVFGGLGSVLDSFLGGWLQASVIDVRSGKIVEGDGGRKVLVIGSSSQALRSSEIAETRSRVGKGEGPASLPNTSALISDHKGGESSSRQIESGRAILDNNAVNLLMAALISVDAMATAMWWWDIPLSSILVF